MMMIFLKFTNWIPNQKIFLKVTRYLPSLDIIKFFLTSLDMLKKSCFVEIFSCFSKKHFLWKWKFQQKALFIEIYNWFRENILKSSNYFNKGTFFVKIYFSSKFFVSRKGKNLIMSSGRGYLVASRKFF